MHDDSLRGSVRRHGRRPLMVQMTLYLLLVAASGAQSAPACFPEGTSAGDDSRGLPTVQPAKGSLACMPADTALGREVHERFEALAPSHAFETRGQLPENGTSTADLYRALHAISSMQGIRYFSVMHNRERVLFKTAYAIDWPGSAVEAPDPAPSAGGNGVSYALVDDVWFGNTPYRMEYRSVDNSILLLVTNLQPLRLFIIPIIDSERLLIALLITPTGGPGSNESRILYGLVAAQAPEVPFLNSRVEDSLRNRLAAMENWIRARAAAAAAPRINMKSEVGGGGADTSQRYLR